MNACSWRPSLVTLIDGRQVLSDSEEWRHECEARTILSMPGGLSARRRYLYGTMDDKGVLRGGVRQKRGEEAVKRLQETMTAIWHSQ